MPESLQKDRGMDRKANRDMVKNTIDECLHMKLLVKDDSGERVGINPELPGVVRSPETAEALLPLTLTDLLFAEDNEKNHDLGLAIAWYLGQDAYDAPGDWERVSETLGQTTFAKEIGLNNSNPWGQLIHWSSYLGFAWTHSVGGKAVLTPDPTAYLRRRLKQVFDGQLHSSLPLLSVLESLAQVCPVFEGGALRKKVEQVTGPRNASGERRLSSVSVLAWLRLDEEKTIELQFKSDAQPVLFPDGGRTQQFTHVAWLESPKQ
jgi:hypothetical protein